MTQHYIVAPQGDQRLYWFLHILAAAGGTADASDSKWNWINAFCGDGDDPDTVRHVVPISVRYGTAEWHPEPGWLMLAHDLDKSAMREFAMKDIGAAASPAV